MQWYLADAIGPFFKDYNAKRINWSKIPFRHLEREGRLDWSRIEPMLAEYDSLLKRLCHSGFNAITLDDLPHLVSDDLYPAELQTLLSDYGQLYEKLFTIAAGYRLSVFITTDIMFYPAGPNGLPARAEKNWRARFKGLLTRAFEQYPDLAGVIMRIGESDGQDVEGDFLSRITIRNPGQARSLLADLLPVFEQSGRLLIFRTWSVGAYPVGDLIWNPHTLKRVLRGIQSPNLIISMKHGESDFFRYLELNECLHCIPHKKIIELQARREYEGAGEYPSFIGYEHERIRRALQDVTNVAGIQVWCQTGGWMRFRRRTFLESGGIWNEINADVTLRLFQKSEPVEEAVMNWAEEHLTRQAGVGLIELLRLSDEVIRELLYIEPYARRRLFFRRVRLPTLLSVYWDRILINHALRKVMRCFVKDGEEAVRTGRIALRKIRQMQELARKHQLPSDGLDFQYDTFELLAAAREYYFAPYSDELRVRLKKMKKAYRASYSQRYTVKMDFKPLRFSRIHLRRLLRILVRESPRYRWIDQLVTLRLLGWCYPLLRRHSGRWIPKFARKRAMGVDAIFR